MSLPPLMTPGELRAALGTEGKPLPWSTFWKYKQRGDFRRLLHPSPMGSRKYSGARVQQFLAGESTVQFGRGARTA